MKRINNKFILVVITVLVCVVGISIILDKSIDRSVYVERQELLSLVSSTSASVVDQYATMNWEQQEVVFSVMKKTLATEPTVEAGIKEMNRQHDYGDEYFFLVDKNGNYYSSDGVYGQLTDFASYAAQTEDKMEYLSTLPHMDAAKPYLIFRERFSKPMHVRTAHGETEMLYFSYAHAMGPVKQAISSLFNGTSNIFVYDSEGEMLYHDFGIRQLLEGYNIYSKFSKCRLPFGENPDFLIQKCKDREKVAVNISIDDEDFFFCSAPLSISDWSLAFIVRSAMLSELNGNSFSKIILYIALIMFVLGAALIGMVLSSMKRRSDIERLKESEEVGKALKSASQAKTDFLSNMSHDIRTPINGIMGMTTIAMGAAEDPDKVRECLGKIDNASHHLLSLINDVLDMSRIESGKTKVASVPTDIRMVCDNCSSIIKGQLADRDLKYTCNIEAEHTKIYADELHLRQILINILGNAVKFTRDGGEIQFNCKETGFKDDQVTLQFEIKDTGIGMSPEFQKKIFEAFSQEENRERTNYSGTGLGMSITKQLVDLMGGTIDVESEIGKGSTFTVSMSFVIDRELHAKSTKVQKVDSIQGIKILLVEDNELNKEIATELLKINGATVFCAEDGLEALNMFTESAPGDYDVILMDIMMPRMNGLEATKAIRSLTREDAARIPIIAMTANAFDDDVKATQDAGMNAHLSKPIDIKQVVHTIAFYTTK